ncbi:MAG: hypothetical protein AAGC68_05340 [Verrucomicrobiota bacterium]
MIIAPATDVMKRITYLLTIAIAPFFTSEIHSQDEGGAAPMMAPALTYSPSRMIKLLPEHKRQLVLKDGERNPYAKRSPDQMDLNEDGENEEEIAIRSRLGDLRVTGQSRGNKGLRILLGDIILERDQVLPQLLEEQSANLKVIEVSEDSIILGWMDIETGALTGKTMQIGYDLSANVAYALHGQSGSGEEGLARRKMGILRIGEERKKEEAVMAEKDPAKRVPAEVYQAGQ